MSDSKEMQGDSCEKLDVEICRLCAEESQNYVPIFDDNNFYVAEKICKCLPIVVLPGDNLPSCVCKRCLHFLNVSYKLIVTSEKADAELRRRFQTANIFEESKDLNERKSVQTTCPSQTKTARNVSLRELKKRAIAGPVECELCNIHFVDLDAFDEHMESLHLHHWQCSFCDISFDTSAELATHKALKHSDNIVFSKTSVRTEAKDCQLHEETLENEISNSRKTVDENSAKNSEENSEPLSNESAQVKSKINNKASMKKLIRMRGVNNSYCLLKVCEICKISFGDERFFGAHKKIHEAKRMTCVACATEHSSIYDLFLHKRSEHNMYKKVQLKYVCNKCGKFFTNSWQWESHSTKDCPKIYLNNVCKYCASSFSTSHKLSRHLRRHKTEMFDDPTVTKYKCVACPKIFVDKEFYEKHRNVHDPECQDKFRCPLCRRCFRDNVRLKEHKLSIHEGIKPHQCDVCGKSFHRLSNMKVHRELHFGHKCKHCDRSFEKTKELMSHVREAHGIESDLPRLPKKSQKGGSYVCRYCGKKLATYQSLLDHEHIHTGEKPYACKICHKAFRSYTARWAHVQRHEKGNYVCEHCGKCFGYKQNLSLHVQTHAPVEERKHLCSKCGKKFLRKCQLNVHMRIHDGVRPYSCDICCVSFTQIGDMKRHRARHTRGEFRMKKTRQKLNDNNSSNG